MYYFNSLIENINKQSTGVYNEVNDKIDKDIILNTERRLMVEDNRVSNENIEATLPPIIQPKFDSHPTKELINRIVEEIYERDPNQLEYVENLAKLRNIGSEGLIDNHCFFSTNVFYMENMFADLGVYKKDFHITTAENTLWKDRFIIPLRDFNNEVFGFVGYSKFSEAKYVEYSSPMYKAITMKCLGLNNIREILEKRYCIFTEGSFDYFRARQHGFPVIANLGIRFNKLLKPLIDKLDIVFTAYDNDDTGLRNMDTIDSLHPYVYHLQFKPTISGEGKQIKGDMDEALKDLKRVESMRQEVEKRLKFKNVRQPKRILI